MLSVPQAPVTLSPRAIFSMIDIDARLDLTARALADGEEAASIDLYSASGALAGIALDDASRAAAQELLNTGACFTDDAGAFIDLYAFDWFLAYTGRISDYEKYGY